MRAKKGEWVSLVWDLSDYADPVSFEQYDSCPRFLFALEDSLQIESEAINKFDRIRLTGIYITEVFIYDENGTKLPTHYRNNEFMPGDRPSYDEWLKKYHRINFYIAERAKDKQKLNQKNIYLDYTAKILRHDMHSGINTYIPRGLNGLLKRLPEDIIKKYSLDSSILMLKEGLSHTQKIYNGVRSFTNLIKDDAPIEKNSWNVKDILIDYIEGTAYKGSVSVDDIGFFDVDKTLFCIAIGNLIKGGLKFNENENKYVSIYSKDNCIYVKDNGVGLSKDDFIQFCKPFVSGNENSYRGLDLNIAVAIIESHGFSIEPIDWSNGTVFEINTSIHENRRINIKLME